MNFRSLTRVSLRLAGNNPQRQWWEVDKEFVFSWRGVPYRVPVDMDTDGASIPRVFLTLVGGRLDAKVVSAALAHDWAYASGELPRLEADLMFRKALEHHGVGLIRRWLMWFAVWAFGWIVWCRHPKRPWMFAGPRCPNEVDLDDHAH